MEVNSTDIKIAVVAHPTGMDLATLDRRCFEPLHGHC